MLLAGGPDFEEPQTRRCVSLPGPEIYWRLKLAWYAPRVGSYFVWDILMESAVVRLPRL